MPMQPNYPAPIYLCNTTGTGIQTPVLDASDALTPGIPIPIQIVISATATVKIEGAMELDTTGAMVDAIDLSGGGYTTSNVYDLIIGFPFYRVNVTANTGTVKVKINQGSLGPGQKGKAHLVTLMNAATQGL